MQVASSSLEKGFFKIVIIPLDEASVSNSSLGSAEIPMIVHGSTLAFFISSLIILDNWKPFISGILISVNIILYIDSLFPSRLALTFSNASSPDWT